MQSVQAASTHEKMVNSANERLWCTAVSLDPLTVAYLQAQLRRPARHELGDFEYAVPLGERRSRRDVHHLHIVIVVEAGG